MISPLHQGPVPKADGGELAIALPAVGVDDCAGGDELFHPRREGRLAGVREHLQAQPARAGTAHLDDDADEGLAVALAAATAPFVVPSDERLIDLDLVAKRFALERHHRPTQLLQHQPRGLIARQAELALKLHRRNPGRVGSDQIGRPEPQPKRCVSAVHDRPRGDRGLVVAPSAFPQVAPLEHPRPRIAAHRTAKAFGPARGGQIVKARRVVGKALLEVHDAAREVWPAHPTTVDTAPDGTGSSCRYLYGALGRMLYAAPVPCARRDTSQALAIGADPYRSGCHAASTM